MSEATLYTYYEVNFIGFTLNEGNCMICESLEQVAKVLQACDIYFDDDTVEEGTYSVKINGCGMTREAYQNYLTNQD